MGQDFHLPFLGGVAAEAAVAVVVPAVAAASARATHSRAKPVAAGMQASSGTAASAAGESTAARTAPSSAPSVTGVWSVDPRLPTQDDQGGPLLLLLQLPLHAAEDCIPPLGHLGDALRDLPVCHLCEVHRVRAHGPLPLLITTVLMQPKESTSIYYLVVCDSPLVAGILHSSPYILDTFEDSRQESCLSPIGAVSLLLAAWLADVSW